MALRRALCTCESEPIETTGDDDAGAVYDADTDGAAGVPGCFIVLAAGDDDDDDDDDDGGEDGGASPISLTFSLNSESSCAIIQLLEMVDERIDVEDKKGRKDCLDSRVRVMQFSTALGC